MNDLNIKYLGTVFVVNRVFEEQGPAVDQELSVSGFKFFEVHA